MADLQKELTVLGARRMDFKNGNDEIKGVQVWYHTGQVKEENTVGIIPSKAWMPLETFKIYENVQEFPAIAECGMDIDMSKNKLKPVSFDFYN